MSTNNISVEVYGITLRQNSANHLILMFFIEKTGILSIILYKTCLLCCLSRKMFLFLQLVNKHYL